MHETVEQRRRRISILTSHCAKTSELSIFVAMLASCEAHEIKQVAHTAQRLQAPHLIRTINRVLSYKGNAAEGTQPTITFSEDGSVLLGDRRIGALEVLFKPTLPFEAQARIAYEVFFDRFFAQLAVKYKAVVIQDNLLSTEIFVPEDVAFDLDLVWQETVKELFSVEGLRQTFIALVNSVKLTNRGFSALDIPILCGDQALVLAAFNLTNILGLKSGIRKRQGDIEAINSKLIAAEKEKDRERLIKQLEKAIADLAAFEQRYTPLFNAWEALEEEIPEWAGRVQHVRSEFRGVAGTQIAKAGAKIAKASSQISELALKMRHEDYYQLPPLLNTVTNSVPVRRAGDTNTKVCYSCGREIEKKQPVFQANTFIFASPSQRLQSGGSQTQPNVCGACAALAFISPIKLGEGRLVLRLLERGHQQGESERYMLEDQLRMLTIGEFNVVAGRYALLQASEKIGNDMVYDKLGGTQYAIYKVASLFPEETFARYAPEVVIGESTIHIASRHVAWMGHLLNIFPLQRTQWSDKGQFAAFGRTIRHLQQDQVIHAIYELMRSGIVDASLIGHVRLAQIEVLRSEHVRWLDMDNEKSKADFYRDVAGMTGLLYAFCSYVHSKFTGNEQRIEVRKLIERLDDPYNFSYTAAGNTKQEIATLYRQEDMYFSYDEAKRILASIGVAVSSREQINDKEQSQLRVNFDDVVAAYTWLWENRYPKTTEQRDFLYALKLSLHARFPDLIERKQEDK